MQTGRSISFTGSRAAKNFSAGPHVGVRPESTTLLFEENLRPGGTNGYTTSWGTNAHGKMAGCPPSERATVHPAAETDASQSG
ncbi:hypothetical protein [Rhodococcus chondri]|uniref:Uncharacterized protein n=1 Tax=Rhodococcus chondri TaxID=3065941 RepID=A0ABU7JNE9_9NOCA|nr:hypothetical protein [Rhodococcus sp. CC-R104]MEE2031237.1 hypothetical protein [Rhodococcus sp. CC-R104]